MWRRLPQAPLVAGPCTGAQAGRGGSGGRGAGSQRGADARARAAQGARRGPLGRRLLRSRFTFADTWVNFCRQHVLRRRSATQGMEEGATDCTYVEKAARQTRSKPLLTRMHSAKAELGEREKPRSSARNQIAEIRPAAPRSPRPRVTRHPAKGAGGLRVGGGQGRKPAAPGEDARAANRKGREASGLRGASGAENCEQGAGAEGGKAIEKRPARGAPAPSARGFGDWREVRGSRRHPSQNCDPSRAREPEAAAGGRQNAEVSGQ